MRPGGRDRCGRPAASRRTRSSPGRWPTGRPGADGDPATRVSYNPSRDDAFVAAGTRRAVAAAAAVGMTAGRGEAAVLAWGVRYPDEVGATG